MILTSSYTRIRLPSSRVAFGPAGKFEDFTMALEVRLRKFNQLVGDMKRKGQNEFIPGDQNIPRFMDQVMVDLDEVLHSAALYAGQPSAF